MLAMMATLPDAYWDAWMLRQFLAARWKSWTASTGHGCRDALHVREIERVEELYPLFFKGQVEAEFGGVANDSAAQSAGKREWLTQRRWFRCRCAMKASRQLKTFEGKFRQTMGGLADTGAEGGGFATLTADVTSLEGAMSMLGATAPQVAIGMAALGLGKQAVEAAQRGGRGAGARDGVSAPGAKSGTSGATMLASLRDASSGMISDADLMLAANSAMALGVADNVQEVTNLLQIAIAKGAEFGQAPTKAFGDLINGLRRMSPEILNNIGIIVDADKAYKDYAQSIGTTAGALDDQQRMQALVNAVLEANPDAKQRAAEAEIRPPEPLRAGTWRHKRSARRRGMSSCRPWRDDRGADGFLTKVNDVQKIMGGEILMTPEDRRQDRRVFGR